jgi:predicted DsbA family dithiol-disulfide isomerase
MADRIALTCFSDVLCIWACVAQARLDEITQQFPDQVEIDHRFCSVFGDTAHKIGVGWADRGGYAGFGKHVCGAAASFDHLSVAPEVWQQARPASSMPAHLMLKAVQQVSPAHFDAALRESRRAFFEQCRDIGRADVLRSVLDAVGAPVDAVEQAIACGGAHAALEADQREKVALGVQGSPTFVLDGGRQKLYGNVGYRVIEANIKELLRSPTAGNASWC